MGFTTGLLSGMTLTLSITYLSLAAHARNRANQAAILRQQTDTLNTLVDPQLRQQQQDALDRQFRVSREINAGLPETLKDMWNARLTKEVRKVQEYDWTNAWDRVEQASVRIFRGLRNMSQSESGGSGSSGEGKGV